MTTLAFKSLGLRRLTNPKNLERAIEEVKGAEFGQEFTLDLRGCVFSYTLAKVIEEIILKFKDDKTGKKLTIVHGYSIATENHLVPYLTKRNNIFTSKIDKIEDLKKTLREKNNVELILIGPT